MSPNLSPSPDPATPAISVASLPEIIPARTNAGPVGRLNHYTTGTHRRSKRPVIFGRPHPSMSRPVSDARKECDENHATLVARHGDTLPPAVVERPLASQECEIRRRMCGLLLKKRLPSLTAQEVLNIRAHIIKVCEKKIRLKDELKLGLTSRADALAEVRKAADEMLDVRPTDQE